MRSNSGEALLDLFFEVEGFADHIEGIGDAAGAGDDDGAEVQYPAPDALVNLHAFHTFQKYFDGFPLQKPFLHDHALVGDPELGAQIVYPYHQSMDEGGGEKDPAKNH